MDIYPQKLLSPLYCNVKAITVLLSCIVQAFYNNNTWTGIGKAAYHCSLWECVLSVRCYGVENNYFVSFISITVSVLYIVSIFFLYIITYILIYRNFY